MDPSAKNWPSIDANYVIEEIKEKSKNGFTKQEMLEIDKLYDSVKPEDDKSKVTDYIEKEVKDTARSDLLALLNNIEQEVWTLGFDQLEKDFENKEATKDFLEVTGSYIESSLVWDFSSAEKDNIKLIMIWEIQKKINTSSIFSWITNKILEPMKKALESFNNKDKSLWDKTKDAWTELKKVQSAFSDIFKDLWLEWEVKKIEAKIKDINTEKKAKKTKFKDLSSVVKTLKITNLKWKTNERIFNTIKKETSILSKRLEWLRGSWTEIAKAIEKTWFWEQINWFLKGLAEWEWFFAMIMKFILWALFWKDFLNWNNDAMKKSTKNLTKTILENKKVVWGSIDEEKLKKMDPKKLEKCYKFLDWKKIDYSWEDFWEKILTWKGTKKGDEISKLHNILLEDWKTTILENWQDLDDLLVKLNWLGDVLNKQESEKAKKDLKTNKQSTEKATTALSQVSWLSLSASAVSKDKDTTVEVVTNVDDTANTVEVKDTTVEVVPTTEEELIEDLSEMKVMKFFSEKYEENIYKDLKLWEITVADFRKILIEKYNDPRYKDAFNWIDTVEKLINSSSEISNKITTISNGINFENSVLGFSKLGDEIEYKWKKIVLNIEWNNIVLGKDKYKVSIMAETYWERFKKIEFIDWNFVLNNDKKWSWTIITKDQIKELIPKLIVSGKFDLKWVEEKAWLLWWDVPYILTISKI